MIIDIMSDVEIKFERENRDGIVAVGTYLIDAMKRFGIRPEGPCIIPEKTHYCAVQITNGSDLLSSPTADETEYFKAHGQKEHERLACEVIIEKSGEVTVMTEETKTDEQEEKNQSEDYRKTFEEMPLEKKIANLVRFEAITLGETFSFIANSPYMIFEKIGDVMAEFGFKLEKDAKAASRPKEHAESGKAQDEAQTNGDNREKPEASSESSVDSEERPQ